MDEEWIKNFFQLFECDNIAGAFEIKINLSNDAGMVYQLELIKRVSRKYKNIIIVESNI